MDVTPHTKQNKFWALVFCAAIILLITSGIRLSQGLFVPPLSQLEHLSIVGISFALAVNQLMWGVSQPIMGALADRFGSFKVLLVGALLLFSGSVIFPFWVSQTGLLVTIGLLLAFGSGAGSFSVLIGLVANRIPSRFQGLSSGIINAGSSFGQFLFAPILQFFITSPIFGWRGAMAFLAISGLLTIPLAYLLVRKPKNSITQSIPDKPVKHHSPSPKQGLKNALRIALANRSYQLLHLGFFTCGFHIAFLVTHLPVEVTLMGLKSDVASWSLALIGLSNVVGSLFIGWCVGHFLSKYILFWMYLSRALLIGLYLVLPATPLTFYCFAIGLGLTWLATVPPTAATVSKLFGVKYLATLFGLTLFTHQVGAFLGAYIGGLVVDHFGQYQYMWYADMVLAALAALWCLPIKEKLVTELQ